MSQDGSIEHKNPTPSGSPRASSLPVSPADQRSPNAQPRGWCRGIRDCLSTKPSISRSSEPQSISTLEQQVSELEKEVHKQKEFLAVHKKRMERTQDYLRYCLQMAKDKGFLDIIMQRKHDENEQQTLSPSQFLNGTSSPQLPVPVQQQHADLQALIEFQEQVAQGSTANIYRGNWRGTDVAVKCLFPDFFHSNENGVSFFAQEIETLARQRHRFVLQLMGACLNPPEQAWVVTEFLRMTLKEWLHGRENRRKERIIPLPPLKERVTKALEIAQGMQYLHEQKPMIVHRDLKPSNIFLDEAMHVRVADFGHARFLNDDEWALTGTYVYMAPEVVRCEPYNEKCDVYSFAVILNELITGDHPYIGTDYGPAQIALEIGEGRLRPALPADDGNMEDLIELIQISWSEDFSLRPSFAAITSSLRNIQNRI
ncbi:Serine-threonine/tyrosine-protein kinase, catalytic domain [Dillenia turbinata]|uniref:Serine-threonine/tyrosine-protein kinase, catalytic domain n=1 Tax=Dillenia turbinata TaxID=194707 RepID=A0AAN8Z5H2_9MAGN